MGTNSTVDVTSTSDLTTASSTTSEVSRIQYYCLKVLRNWNFTEADTCRNPCGACFKAVMDRIYYSLKCSVLNGYFPMFKEEPMLFDIKIHQILSGVNEFTPSSYCKAGKYHIVKKSFLLTFGKRFRLSDQNLPEYTQEADFGKRRKWEGINDTAEIPYGNIVRGDYAYTLILYKNNMYFKDKKLPLKKQRLKKNWPEKHPIINGEYLDPRNEEGLYFNEKLEFNSHYISFQLTPSRPYPLPGTNKISFKKVNPEMVKPVCVYWQALKGDHEDELPPGGYWSNYGVKVHKENESFVVCMASHTGFFGVVAENPEKIEEKSIDPLDVLVVLFTLISCIIIFLFIASLFLLKCIKYPYSRIYLYLASSCLLAQLIFIFGLKDRKSWKDCTTAGTWIQFCHVGVVTWIMLEGVHQLSRIRYFFNNKTNIDAFYFILGWGFPIAVAIALQGFPYKEFAEQRYCWIIVDGYDIWFFAGPLVVILLITIGIKIITFMDIRKKPEKLASDINYQRAKRSLLASVGIIPTFMALWIFGTYALQSDAAVGKVALVALPLLNLAVGCEIFYFYFYRNDEVRDALKREFRIREKQKINSYHYVRGLNMKAMYKPSKDRIDVEYDNPSFEIQESETDKTVEEQNNDKNKKEKSADKNENNTTELEKSGNENEVKTASV